MLRENKADRLRDAFLKRLEEGKSSVTIYLVNGVKLQGVVSGFSEETLLLERDGYTQLVYCHAISTILPSEAFGVQDIQDIGAGEVS